jgi:hypothetical protein
VEATVMGFLALGFGTWQREAGDVDHWLGLRLVRLGGDNFLGLGLVRFLLVGFCGRFRFAPQHLIHGSGFEFGGGNDLALIRRLDFFDRFGRAGFFGLDGLGLGHAQVAHVGLRNRFEILAERWAGGNGFAGNRDGGRLGDFFFEGAFFLFEFARLAFQRRFLGIGTLDGRQRLAIKPVLQPLTEFEVRQE